MSFNSNSNLTPDAEPRAGILDAVIESEQAHALADFTPYQLVMDSLNQLRERERQILSLRYGLTDNNEYTLEAIGKKLNLTRERVRQVEKESIRTIKKGELMNVLNQSMDIVRKTISDHGGIFEQSALVDHLLISNKTPRHVNSLVFLLDLSDHFSRLDENHHYHTAWYLVDFNVDRLHSFREQLINLLTQINAPVELEQLKSHFRNSEHFQRHSQYYTDKVIENLLRVSKAVKANPFGEYGMRDWRVIEPKDVGDKAYLVLKHTKQPLHYTKITELINQHAFDDRTAYKETVHNELIMDERFVLVGRGIYALSEWGYKKGLVADIIKEILSSSIEPVDRNKLVEEVLKQRVVRRNTVLVGLANKQLFRKVGKNKYTLA